MSKRDLWLGLIGALIMIYPNLAYIPWHMEWPCVQQHLWLYWCFHVFRFLYFAAVIILVYRMNITKGWTSEQRLTMSICVSVVAYGLFAYISHSLSEYGVYDKIGSMLILKFIVICGLGKLTFDIQIDNQQKTIYMLPVLTLLPVIENVIVHNCIDTAHSMTVSIGINEHGDLFVSNPIYPKHQRPNTNGIGLKNLANRMELMCGQKLRTENSDGRFTVYIPLK